MANPTHKANFEAVKREHAQGPHNHHLAVIHYLLHRSPEEQERAHRRLSEVIRIHGHKPEYAWVHRVKEKKDHITG